MLTLFHDIGCNLGWGQMLLGIVCHVGAVFESVVAPNVWSQLQEPVRLLKSRGSYRVQLAPEVVLYYLWEQLHLMLLFVALTGQIPGASQVSTGGATVQRSGGLANYDLLLQQYHQAQLRAGGASLQQQQLTQSARESVKGFQQGGLATPQDRFGLLGLLSVIRMSDPDLTTLALGTDLTTLGLNLNSRENLYKTFASPWADGPIRGEPEFTLPACYVQRAPRLQVQHSFSVLSSFNRMTFQGSGDFFLRCYHWTTTVHFR